MSLEINGKEVSSDLEIRLLSIKGSKRKQLLCDHKIDLISNPRGDLYKMCKKCDKVNVLVKGIRR